MTTTTEIDEQIDMEECAIARAKDEIKQLKRDRRVAVAEGAYEDVDRLEDEIASAKADVKRRRERLGVLQSQRQKAELVELEEVLEGLRNRAEQAAEAERNLIRQYMRLASPLATLLRQMAAVAQFRRDANKQLEGQPVSDPNFELRGRPASREPDRVQTVQEWQRPDGTRVSTFRIDENGQRVPMEAPARLVRVERTVSGMETPAINPKPLYEAVTLPGVAYNDPPLWNAQAPEDAKRRTRETLAELGIDDSKS